MVRRHDRRPAHQTIGARNPSLLHHFQQGATHTIILRTATGADELGNICRCSGIEKRPGTMPAALLGEGPRQGMTPGTPLAEGVFDSRLLAEECGEERQLATTLQSEMPVQ